MQSTHYTIRRLTFVILDKSDGAYLFIELSLREGFEEIATSILKYPWFNNDHSINRRFNDIHFQKKVFKCLHCLHLDISINDSTNYLV